MAVLLKWQLLLGVVVIASRILVTINAASPHVSVIEMVAALPNCAEKGPTCITLNTGNRVVDKAIYCSHLTAQILSNPKIIDYRNITLPCITSLLKTKQGREAILNGMYDGVQVNKLNSEIWRRMSKELFFLLLVNGGLQKATSYNLSQMPGRVCSNLVDLNLFERLENMNAISPRCFLYASSAVRQAMLAKQEDLSGVALFDRRNSWATIGKEVRVTPAGWQSAQRMTCPKISIEEAEKMYGFMDNIMPSCLLRNPHLWTRISRQRAKKLLAEKGQAFEFGRGACILNNSKLGAETEISDETILALVSRFEWEDTKLLLQGCCSYIARPNVLNKLAHSRLAKLERLCPSRKLVQAYPAEKIHLLGRSSNGTICQYVHFGFSNISSEELIKTSAECITNLSPLTFGALVNAITRQINTGAEKPERLNQIPWDKLSLDQLAVVDPKLRTERVGEEKCLRATLLPEFKLATIAPSNE